VLPGIGCDYAFAVYSSATYQHQSTGTRDITFTIGTAFGIFFIVLIAWLWDWYSEHKLNSVISAALKSNAILSQLFPKIVRDRMIAEKQAQEAKALAKSNLNVHGAGIASILGDDAFDRNSVHSANDEDDDDNDDDLLNRSRPIADLFPETTVRIVLPSVIV
jgi:hypothetical protein